MLSICKLAIQLTTTLLLRKPCKLFASVARLCQRQLGFLVLINAVKLGIPFFGTLGMNGLTEVEQKEKNTNLNY